LKKKEEVDEDIGFKDAKGRFARVLSPISDTQRLPFKTIHSLKPSRLIMREGYP